MNRVGRWCGRVAVAAGVLWLLGLLILPRSVQEAWAGWWKTASTPAGDATWRTRRRAIPPTRLTTTDANTLAG